MNKLISLGLLAASIALMPIICNKKVLGNSEFILEQSDHPNISVSSGFGYIETRNGRIAINSNKSYTIYSKDGKVVAENLSFEELQAIKPELYDMMKDSIAEETLMMDAGIGISR